MLARVLSSWGRLMGLGKQPAAVEEERREFGRISCDVETTCQPTSRDRAERWPARARNVSCGGVCLRLPRAFQPGELICISLPTAGDEAASEILACVVRCDEAEGDGWEVGCTFASPLADADLRRFDARRGPGGPDDQRQWARFRCQAEVVYQVVRSPDPGGTTPAKVVNISGGGIALQVVDPLRVGELLSVELRRQGAAVLTALASVVRTTVERDGKRIIGCNFIHELPEAHLVRLLA
jgi:c-di-GMP-binding flagellar brake protein YcgR